MSLTARLVLILVLLAGATVFVLALTLEPPVEPDDEQQVGTDEPAAPTGPPAQPGVLDSSETCKDCHAEIYAEWKEDRHSKAWVGVLFTELSDGHKDPNCWS